MMIEQDVAVSFHFHLTTSNGAVIQSSKGGTPMNYLHGHHQLVPGVERALVGEKVGSKLKVEVSPEDGYGSHDPALDVTIPVNSFPPHTHAQLQPGVQFQGPHPSDQTRTAVFTVMEVDGSELRCSANHPLAGMTHHFEIEVMDVREATALELQQGRVLPSGATESSGCCSDPNCDN
jgi:FKBP-type peptidyl-prolyl cis-trans isomerase SlyD